MNALELSEKLHTEWRADNLNYDTALAAALILQEQHNELTLMHEAIVKLREALVGYQKVGVGNSTDFDLQGSTYMNATFALKDTEEFQ